MSEKSKIIYHVLVPPLTYSKKVNTVLKMTALYPAVS